MKMINTDKIYKTIDLERSTGYRQFNRRMASKDLLCDLKHFCDEYAIDFDSELSRANNLYLKEAENETI
jgi:hypothetical protein